MSPLPPRIAFVTNANLISRSLLCQAHTQRTRIGGEQLPYSAKQLLFDAFHIRPDRSRSDIDRVRPIASRLQSCPHFLDNVAHYCQLTPEQFLQEVQGEEMAILCAMNTPTIAVPTSDQFFDSAMGANERAACLIHEYIHFMNRIFGDANISHPGTTDAKKLSSEAGNRQTTLGIPYHLAVNNAYCYQFFVMWRNHIPWSSTTHNLGRVNLDQIHPRRGSGSARSGEGTKGTTGQGRE